MAIESYAVGPGSLIFGAPGSPGEQAAQITSATVQFSTESEDDTDVLSGEVLAGEETSTYALAASLLQDLSESGLVQWSWLNRGTVVPFEYVPNSAKGRSITGEVKVRPINVGGDVKSRASSDVEFPGVGFPVLGDVE